LWSNRHSHLPLALDILFVKDNLQLTFFTLYSIMSSSSVADSASQKTSPASSPPPAEMDGQPQNKADGVSNGYQVEEDRMRAQREKQDAKREAELEKERQADIESGKEVLDKKFQQLEFLMNKSKVSHDMRIEPRNIYSPSAPAVRNSHACSNATARRRRKGPGRADQGPSLKTRKESR
jgi:hypothetical protein